MIGGVVANPHVLEGAEKMQTRQPSGRNELAQGGLDERARGGTEGVPQSLPPLPKASGNEVEKPTNRVPCLCLNCTSAQIADR
jgi:hypothetical protein